MDQDMINKYEQYVNDPNTDPTYKVFARSVMYSVFAIYCATAIINALSVKIVLGRLAKEAYDSGPNFRAELAQLKADYNDAVQVYINLQHQAISDYTKNVTGEIRASTVRMNQVREAQSIAAKKVEVSNAASEYVAPQIVTVVTSIGVAAGVVEIIADICIIDD